MTYKVNNLQKIDPQNHLKSDQSLSPELLSKNKGVIENLIPFFVMDNDKGRRIFFLTEFYNYVSDQFGIRRISEGSGLSNQRFILIEKNRIRIIDRNDVNSIITEKMNRSDHLKSFLNDIFKQWKKERTEDSLMFLKPFEGKIIEDSEDDAFAFFRNGYIWISKGKEEPEIIFSEDFPRSEFILESSIVKAEATGERELKPVAGHFEDLRKLSVETIENALINSEIYQFIRLTSGLPKFYFDEDESTLEAKRHTENLKQRFRSICSAIGFQVHGFKRESGNKAIIFVDEIIPEDNNREGRSGKSLICRFLLYWFGNDGRFKVIDGSNRRSDDRFGFSQVTKETKNILLNDVPPNYDLNEAFNAVTKDGVKIEQKKINSFMKYDLKVMITTNKTISGEGASFKDRMHEIELSSYFNDNWKPVNEFGHEFFNSAWSGEQWNLFNWFMIYCLALYLQEGLISYEPINLSKRKLINNSKFWKDARSMNLDSQELLRIYESDLQRRILNWENLTMIPRREIIALISEATETEEKTVKDHLNKSYLCFLQSKGLKVKSDSRKGQDNKSERVYIISNSPEEIRSILSEGSPDPTGETQEFTQNPEGKTLSGEEESEELFFSGKRGN